MLESYSTKDFGLSQQLQLTRASKPNFLNTEMPEILELDEEEEQQYRNSSNETKYFSAHISTQLDVSIQQQSWFLEEKKKAFDFQKLGVREPPEQYPYQKSIAKICTALTDKSLSPLEKLIQIRDVTSLIKSEIQEFWVTQSDIQEFQIELDRSDILSILIYILIKAKIDDLRAQLIFIESFCSFYIQEGYSKISAAFSDFKNAVNFICSLDKEALQAQGPIYLQNVQLDKIRTMMYQYSESIDGTSVRTGYDIYGVANLLDKGDQSLAGSVLSINHSNGISNKESLFSKNREASKSLPRKHIINIKQSSVTRKNEIQNGNLLALIQDKDQAKPSLCNSSQM